MATSVRSIILLLIITIIACVFILPNYFERAHVKSEVDGNVYIIRSGLKDKDDLQKSANALGTINIKVLKLIDYLKTMYSTDPNRSYFIKKLEKNYSPKILSEAAIDKRYTTYTVDKSDMYICLRTRDNKRNLYDTNTLMYVVLHELAHLCNYDIQGNPIHGHGIEFKMIFKTLVKSAIDSGVYTYQNYSLNPVEYCGLYISSQIATN
jgi:hypothetical protein